MGTALLKRLSALWKDREKPRSASPPASPAVPFFQDHAGLKNRAEEVGKDWRGDSRVALDYYKDAEQWMEHAWAYTIWPFIQHCDFSCVVDLAAGHGRNSNKLLAVAKKLYVVDINEDNIRFCQQRFATEPRIIYLQNDGFTLSPIPSDEITLVYCFDAMVHFDSDVVRSYLRDFYRVLQPEGYGFCHHSNYDRNPGGGSHDNPGWRNFMSQQLFLHYCKKEGFEIVQSQVIDWGTPELDCVTLFRKPLRT